MQAKSIVEARGQRAAYPELAPRSRARYRVGRHGTQSASVVP
jgi:hypothetical protein